MIRNHSLSLPSSGISLFLFFTRQRFLYFVIVIADSYSEQRTHLTRQKFTVIIPYRLIQNGMTKLVNIKHQDAVTKVLDMVPDIVNRFTGGNDITPDAAAKAEEMASKMEKEK